MATNYSIDDPNDPNRPDTITSPDGNTQVLPPTVDYSSLIAPFINFQAAFDFAQKIGQQNRETFFTNIDRSKDSALKLIDTDIEGIKRGVDALSPIVRQQGDIDTQTNIVRAGKIDDYNIERLPGFNALNRTQTSASNEFNRSEREAAVESSGLDYRDRIMGVLDDLQAQTEGRLPAALDEQLTKSLRNQGSELAAASGVGSLSGAGVRANDRLTIGERIKLQQSALAQIPGVLTTGQSVLASPEERAATLYAQPTQVPLNVSNVADRIPVQANISAGNAQRALATEATNYEIIPAPTALAQRIQTDQFNTTSEFSTDKLKLDEQKAQETATAQAYQSLINQDKLDEQFQAGLDQRESAQQLQAITSLAGTFGGIYAASQKQDGSNPVGEGIISGAKSVGNAVLDGVGSVIDGAVSLGDSLLGDGDGKVAIGDTEISGQAFKDFFKGIGNSIFGTTPAPAPSDIGGSPIIGATSNDDGSTTYIAESGASETINGEAAGLVGAFKDAASALPAGVDEETVMKAGATVYNWGNLSSTDQLTASVGLASDIAEKRGILTQEQAAPVKTASEAITVLSNPNATSTQKAAAIGTAAAQAAGSPGTVSAVRAYSVLNSGASADQKLAALTALGLPQAQAANIISATAAGNTMAGLSLFNTATNWDEMDPVQKAVSLAQTGQAVFSAASAATQGSAAATGASTFAASSGAGAGAAGGLAATSAGFSSLGAGPQAGIVVGAYLTAKGIQDAYYGTQTKDPVSVAARIQAAYSTGLFSEIGPLVGIQSSGKDTGRKMRDAWRGGLQEAGIADDNFDVTLADGTKYNIGQDGKTKLKNTDGTARNTFDVDWSNQTTVDAIPDAHIFAIATGLDPTDASSRDLFDRATAQSLNAASSNAKDINGVRANFKTMLDKKGMQPGDVGVRLEVLRNTNRISEQEYGVYLNRVNKIYGTDFTPIDRAQSQKSLIQQIQSQPRQSAGSKKLLAFLMSPEEQAKAQKRLNERLTA